jgi:hypothetical protein
VRRSHGSSPRFAPGPKVEVTRQDLHVLELTALDRVNGQHANGKATAVAFAREGAKVFCVDINPEAAAETVSIIESEGGTTSPPPCYGVNPFA